MTLQALIFDVDGTLAETEEIHRQAFNGAFASANLDWHWDQALYAELLAVTGGKERIAHFQQIADIRNPLPADRIAVLHADKTARYAARIASGGLALRPGVRRLLNEAHTAGLRLAIATTTSRANVDALLAACAPLPAFDVIAAGDEVPRKKPAPDIYLAALQRLALPPGSCIAFEDTENGLLSALGAGLRCVVTCSVYGGGGPFPGAASVVTHLGDPGQACTMIMGEACERRMIDVPFLAGLPHNAA